MVAATVADLRAEPARRVTGPALAVRCTTATPSTSPTRILPGSDDAAVTAVPYYAWDHRAPGEMVVWIAEHPALAERPPLPTPEGAETHFGEDGK